MKKFLCLTLAALSLSAILTGCAGTTYPGSAGSNISTSRDGTVNGYNRGGGLLPDMDLDTAMDPGLNR